MTITRRDFITHKYNTLTEYCYTHLGKCPFPSLEDLDLTDILYLFVNTFSPLYNIHDYRRPLKDMMNMCSIQLTDDEFEEHYPYFQKEIDELCLFLKNQK